MNQDTLCADVYQGLTDTVNNNNNELSLSTLESTLINLEQ
ncbi:4557_t:CDS:2 [Cetraspora pellucida]|uniref:4557_t:CDS:1 n=1 Tax=Cetraspora pellucida TaxID=1433469 RepID=A0A9N8W2M3_9GLOM|nr:4557_t:CDS:2 [Cetraspora pellucida]